MRQIHVLPILAPHTQEADCPCGPLAVDITDETTFVVHSSRDPRSWRDTAGNWAEGYWPSPELEAQLDAAKEATTDERSHPPGADAGQGPLAGRRPRR